MDVPSGERHGACHRTRCVTLTKYHAGLHESKDAQVPQEYLYNEAVSWYFQ